MSNKFNVRPAPRKRPWICKASPPALKPPTTPQPLICSFSLRWLYPPADAVPFEGSFKLTWFPVLNLWTGVYIETINRFDITFRIDPLTRLAEPIAVWDYFHIFDQGSYSEEPAGEFPLIHYKSSTVIPWSYRWSTTLLITS